MPRQLLLETVTAMNVESNDLYANRYQALVICAKSNLMSIKPSPRRGHQAASWNKSPQWQSPPGDQDKRAQLSSKTENVTIGVQLPSKTCRAEGLRDRLRAWQWGQKHEKKAGRGKVAAKALKGKAKK